MIYHASPTRTLLGQSWAVVIDRLCAVVAHHAARRPGIAALLAAAYYRMLRTIARLDRLALRWQNGTLPRPRKRASRPNRREPATPPPPRLPSGRLWLVRLVQPTAALAGQVATLLAHPDTIALAAAAPQAGRLLRPLCRALGVAQPDWLRLPDRPRTPRPRPARPAPPAPDISPDRPLPRYVLAAARAWKKRDR